MSVVPLNSLWVDANFKEVQVAKMRIGQPVTLTSDVYGGKVEYHGKVIGLSAGTGAAFALLPTQNAAGTGTTQVNPSGTYGQILALAKCT